MVDGTKPGSGPRKNARSPTPIDTRIGQLIRERRTALGLRLEDLATSLGIAPHQLQKYETGGNRVPASRLVECARFLQVSVSWFYNEADASSADMAEVPDEAAMVQLFRRLDDKSRAQLLRIARVLDGSLPPEG